LLIVALIAFIIVFKFCIHRPQQLRRRRSEEPTPPRLGLDWSDSPAYSARAQRIPRPASATTSRLGLVGFSGIFCKSSEDSPSGLGHIRVWTGGRLCRLILQAARHVLLEGGDCNCATSF
jgi:hypothetical protein